MNELFPMLLGVAAILACLAAFFVVLNVLFPRQVARAQQLARQSPGRSFLIGLVNFLFFGALALGLSSLADQTGFDLLRLVTVLVMAAIAAAMTFGLAGMIQQIGEQVWPDAAGIRRTIQSSLLVGLACLLPFLGWFFLLPVIALTGLGALILSLFARTPAPVEIEFETAPQQ